MDVSRLKGAALPAVPENIPHGDMPGDVVKIDAGHIAKAGTIFPLLLEQLEKAGSRAVVSVFGGSGVGKSEIASLLGYYLTSLGLPSYVLSGDNYPRRIPLYNDAERASVFRAAGLKALVKEGLYTPEVRQQLSQLWEEETDPDPALCARFPWLSAYQAGGRGALTAYLGTDREQDYEEINAIIGGFRRNEGPVFLKRMGRTEAERWYDAVDFSDIPVLLIEWTHGGNPRLEGIDVQVLLNSTPEETREHRRLRARDGKTDSAFTTMVLEIEQKELDAARGTADIVIAKSGEILA